MLERSVKRVVPSTSQVNPTLTLARNVAHAHPAPYADERCVRGPNEAYIPHHLWSGAIGDTPALEGWVASLSG